MVAAWVVTSLAAGAGLYKLWYTREWRLYGGKTTDAQREAVFAHVGFDAYLLRDALALDRTMPAHITAAMIWNDEVVCAARPAVANR